MISRDSMHWRQRLTITVVGHTNVGKTTLLRTLLRDKTLGEVSNQRASTKKIEPNTAFFRYNKSRFSIRYIDTPGMESPLYFTRAIERVRFNNDSVRGSKGFSKVHVLDAIEEVDVQQQFPIETNCLNQILLSDACYYVVDTRLPVLSKFQAELELIKSVLKPIIVVLNYADSSLTRLKEWQSYLVANGFHSYLTFDPTRFSLTETHRLQDLLNVLGPEFDLLIEGLVHTQTGLREKRIHRSAVFVAELLLKLSAYRLESSDAGELVEKQPGMKKSLTHVLEKRLVSEISNLLHITLVSIVESYRYEQTDVDILLDDVTSEINNLLDVRFVNLKAIARESQNGAVTGAVTGVGLDAAFIGISFGSAAVVGAVTGAFVGLRKHTSRLFRQLFQGNDICVSTESLVQIANAMYGLIIGLESRGHGAQKPLTIQTHTLPVERAKALVNHTSIQTARLHPEWFSVELSSDTEAYPCFNQLRQYIEIRLLNALHPSSHEE